MAVSQGGAVVSEPTFWIPAIKTAEDGFNHPTMIKSTNAGFVAFKDYLNLQSANEELKRDLRQQIELNALAQIGFKMYIRNVESGGLHKDRKDAIERYEKEVSNLKTQIERLTKAGDAMANTLRDGGVIVSGYSLADEWLKAKLHAAKGVQP